MVETAAKAVGEWLGKLLLDEAQLLIGVKDKVEILRDQLLWMEACLLDAQKSGLDSYVLSLYVSQVKELAKDSQHVIQDYLEKVLLEDDGGGSSSSKWKGMMSRSIHLIRSIQPRHEVDSKINALKDKMSTLKSNLQIFKVDLLLKRGTQAEEKAAVGRLEAQGRVPKGGVEKLIDDIVKLQQQEEEEYPELREGHPVVGREEEEKAVIDLLVNTTEEVRFVTMYGVRGIGKTILAKLVFHNEEVEKHFGKCYWVLASSGHLEFSLFMRRLYCSVVGDIGEREFDESAEQELVSGLQRARDWLIVIDDVGDNKLLKNIVEFFSSNMKRGSKVLLTMRDQELARSIKPREARAYCLRPMHDTEGWQLLETTMQLHEFDTCHECTDANANSIVNGMLYKCKGNPLAIVTLGMACAGKAIEEWKDTCDMILMLLYPEKRLEHALQATYNMLPDSVKSCVLHLCHVPENYPIPVAMVIRMWIAEGFVASMNRASSSEESLEDIARDMLNKLVELSLVQVHHSSGDSTQGIEFITMHKLVRKFFLHKAFAKDLIHLIETRSNPWPYKCKTMAVYFDENLDSFNGASKNECKEQLKSLFTYPVNGFMKRSDMEGKCQKFLEEVCREFTWLRILHLQRLPVGGSFPEQIKNMMFLRYLSLKGTYITDVPSSIGDLIYLQILDLRVCLTEGKVVMIPNTLCKATRLIYLFLPVVDYIIADNQVLKLDTLEHLESLKNAHVSKCRIRDLGKLTKMRSLSLKLMKLSKKDSLKLILSSFTSLKNLQRLSIRVEGVAITQKSDKWLRHAPLYRLDVVGRISGSLRDKTFPPGLAVLKLELSELEADPMSVLMWLPNLRNLTFGKMSFLGAVMICCADGFVQLRKLKLASLPKLQQLIIEEGALPRLGQLVIDSCEQLTTCPRYLHKSVKVVGKELTKVEEEGIYLSCPSSPAN